MKRIYTDSEIKQVWKILNSNKSSMRKLFVEAAEKINSTDNSIRIAYHKKNSWLHKNTKTKSPFNESDIKICLAMIRKHPDNLRHASRLASKEIGISAETIMGSYYSKRGVIGKRRNNNFFFRLAGFFSVFKKNMKNNVSKGKTSL